ncbi:MAG: hypothetical protein HY511_06625 [Actinobacteria bacterium]|nr:hypothetical protein [Actinomycetota bacterium]
MKKKRRWTPEQWAEHKAHYEARMKDLREHMARIETEIADRRRAKGEDAAASAG